jgi:hypothetical protein
VRLLLCGRVATARYYEKAIWYNSQYSQLKKNNGEKKDKTEEEKLDIKTRALQRTKNNVYNLISTNAWFWKRNDGSVFLPCFLTLTFKENITNIKEGNYLHSKFIKRLNYYVYKTKKTQLKYLSVIEFQKKTRKAIHYHIVFFNLPYIHKKELAEIWDLGFILIKALNPHQNVAGYLTKYITKSNFDPRLDGKKRYMCSRKLLKPIEINVESEALILISKIPKSYIKNRAEFESEHHGMVKVTEYDFGQGKTFKDVTNNMLVCK